MWWPSSVIARRKAPKQSQKEAVMFNSRSLLNFAVGFHAYIWVDVFLVKETPKAILIMFDNRKIWLPKAWIARIKRNKNSSGVRIKISEYHWAKKSMMFEYKFVYFKAGNRYKIKENDLTSWIDKRRSKKNS